LEDQRNRRGDAAIVLRPENLDASSNGPVINQTPIVARSRRTMSRSRSSTVWEFSSTSIKGLAVADRE
jgi:hypothetical protein